MDLLILFFVFMGTLIALLVLLARFWPGSGADLLDWRPGRDVARRMTSEAEDMESMLAHHNAKRRSQGLPEQTEDQIRVESERLRRLGQAKNPQQDRWDSY